MKTFLKTGLTCLVLSVVTVGMVLVVSAAACTSDAECDDGLFCTGTETCVGGSCAAVSACPPAIDGCVSRGYSCDEANDACVDFADDSLCDDGDFYNGRESCDINTGDCRSGILPLVVDLIAGGGGKGKSAVDAGDVLVWNDADNLYVRYIGDDPWCIIATHLEVASTLGGIPQKNGNPIPGAFTYSDVHACATAVPYEIPLQWEPGTQLIIAAHAAVRKEVLIGGITTFKYETAWGSGIAFPGKNWATYFTYTIPDPRIDIEKSVNGVDADSPPGPTILAGSLVTFAYVVTNRGNVPLSNVVVVDDALGTTCTAGSLDAGQAMTCTFTLSLTGLGQHSNTGTVTAAYGATDVSDSDAAHFVIELGEACCFIDFCGPDPGSCTDATPGTCTAAGGYPQGPGTACSSASCGIITTPQACCFADGRCIDTAPDVCSSPPNGDGGGQPAGCFTACLGDANGNGTDDACESLLP